MTVLYVLLGILIFGVLVAFHEFGHFTAAKLSKVRVEEFSVGMGPALFKKQKGETLYALRCIPFGGYCAMTGEDGESDDPRAFVNQPVWKKLIILVAGSFNNFLLGFLIVFVLVAGSKLLPAPGLTGFMEGCPYEGTFQIGDVFQSINGKRVATTDDVISALSKGDGSYDFVLLREGKTVELSGLTLERREFAESEGLKFGFLIGTVGIEATAGSRLSYTWRETWGFVKLVWESLRMLVQGEVGVNDLSGPVGIVDMMAETGAQAETTGDALYSIFYLAAFITVNLSVMNMLPIPALDGGRIFLLLIGTLIEKLSRKKLDPRYEGYIHAGGMVLLLALMGYVMLHDIFRLVTK